MFVSAAAEKARIPPGVRSWRFCKYFDVCFHFVGLPVPLDLVSWRKYSTERVFFLNGDKTKKVARMSENQGDCSLR